MKGGTPLKGQFKNNHTIDAFFSLLLFGLFSFLLLLLLLFSAKVYQSSVKGLDENQNLHTAMTYVTTKIRQHGDSASVFLEDFEGLDALCLKDEIDNQIYTTYIYLLDGELKELFSTPASNVSPKLGTTIAKLHSYSIEETEGGFFLLSMEDFDENRSEMLLHPSIPVTQRKEEP